MKVVPLYCPNCGAPVGKDAKFCSQCGSPIVIDDGVKRSEHTVRHIDEARIRESEADELIRLRKLEVELAKEREKTKQQKTFEVSTIITIIVFFGCMALITFFLTHYA